MTISRGSKSVDTKKSQTICCMLEANVFFSILTSQGRVTLHPGGGGCSVTPGHPRSYKWYDGICRIKRRPI